MCCVYGESGSSLLIESTDSMIAVCLTLCPHSYGEDFIREAYLYHITRRDIKHNFSVYFYLLYLVDGSWLSLPVGLLAFLPQAALLLLTAARFSADITFCCFVQTVVFVTFNKVCTSQVHYSCMGIGIYIIIKGEDYPLSLSPPSLPLARSPSLPSTLCGI